MVQQLGPNDQLAKFDIKSPFRIMPVNPGDFELLSIHFQGQYYFDKCLPFGCSISCSVFEKFSPFLQWHMLRQLPYRQLKHYLDDFLTVGRHGSGECEQNLGTCLTALSDLGVPIAHEKTVAPATCLILHNLEIDTANMKVRIPPGKVSALITTLLSSVPPILSSSANSRGTTIPTSRQPLDPLTREADRLLQVLLASNTWSTYQAGVEALRTFWTTYGIQKTWPVPLDNLVHFIAYLSKTGLAPSTLRTYISGTTFIIS
ncbi:uncharacterized protein [Haliotis asinina]|uniref:uncharacterized protein n=1 Tax=Haliotis asinina TaxID=109174 RepID=UPI0035327C96